MGSVTEVSAKTTESKDQGQQGSAQEKDGGQAPAEECMRCVVRDEDHGLQAKGGSDR